ncbi:MAG: glutathione binding-like protein [Woeseiaceae bacterium]
MKLYSASGTCSAASHIALLEAGLKFDVVKLDLRGDRKLPDGRYLKDVNPKGYVPALELGDGTILTENVAVLLYIADRAPGSDLAPDCGSMQRFRIYEWLGFINSEVHKTYSNFFNPKLSEEMRSFFAGRLQTRLAYVDGRLTGRDYLMGENFTVADCYLYVVTGWSSKLGIDIERHGALLAWRDRVGERDAVRRAMSEG